MFPMEHYKMRNQVSAIPQPRIFIWSTMFPAASLLTTLLLAISIAATPVEVRTPRVTLPFAKRINTSGGAIKLVEHDQARAAALKDRGAALQSGNLNRRTASIAVTNEAVSYVAAVAVGNPATTCVLCFVHGTSRHLHSRAQTI